MIKNDITVIFENSDGSETNESRIKDIRDEQTGEVIPIEKVEWLVSGQLAIVTVKCSAEAVRAWKTAIEKAGFTVNEPKPRKIVW